ncbi:hypothetical protein MMC24_002510 [Lignoscripta atroalba]|nr:hypothetical protein [Lignoscripta atroalba]
MAPSGLAILIGAGPNTVSVFHAFAIFRSTCPEVKDMYCQGTGIARILSHPSHGNLAVALLARSPDTLSSTRSNLHRTSPSSVIETFPTDTSASSLSKTFSAIRAHPSFKDLKLRIAIYNIKHSSKKPFMTETHADFTTSLETYVGGAMAFAQESLKLFFEQNGDEPLSPSNPNKKGTLIFTGTLGALRSNAEFSAYGAGRAGVRQLAQSLAKEFSVKGVHVVHTVANGGIVDVDVDDSAEAEKVKEGKKMSAEAVGKTYLWLMGQGVELWTHELDMRPAQEKF